MSNPRSPSCRSGFTLVELLAAMAILAVMVAALGTIMGTASNVTTSNDSHIDADGRARTVFDRMANDFAQMVKRSDVDFIFCKAPGNDTIFFYTEGASYYDGATPDNKNRVSLVGYRVDKADAVTSPSYGQLQRLGKTLMWDTSTAANPAAMAFLNYPTTGGSCAAYPLSTLAGGTTSGPAVGTAAGYFNDGADSSYHPLASNVFRLEYSFQLKDGTQSTYPLMQHTASNANGVPSFVIAGTPPTTANNSTQGYVVGSRWYDSADQIGYICVDPTPTTSNVTWHQIGIQDISAVVVTIAVMDDQAMVFVKNGKIDLVNTVASAFPDLPDGDAAPATDLVNTWTKPSSPPLREAR